MQIPKQVTKMIGKTVNFVTSAVSQTSVKTDKKEYPAVADIEHTCLQAAAESFVLLKNEGAILPFSANETVSVFGRLQFDTFFVGYGSGGDVNAHYTVNINQGIKNNGKIKTDPILESLYASWIKKHPADNGFWGHWPMCHEEMHISEAVAAAAADRSDAALVIIGRAAGEDRENTLTKGSFYLTDEEENLLQVVRRHFKKTAVILNIGNIIDFSWVEKFDIPCVGICWQGGMETGNAVAAVLSGDVSPSGKLTDTIAVSYESYPSSDHFGNQKKNDYEEDIFVGYRYFETFDQKSVLFPFGHGLTYSDFSLSDLHFARFENKTQLRLQLKNTGNATAANVVQVYYSQNGSALYSPDKMLVAFQKSRLLDPGQSEEFCFEISDDFLALFDDEGITGNRHAMVLPEGDYHFYIGFNVRNVQLAGSFQKKICKVVANLKGFSAPSPEEHLMRLVPIRSAEKTYRSYAPAPVSEINLKKEILDHLPKTIETHIWSGEKLSDVENGLLSLEEFTALLSDDELEAISRGDYIMNSPLGPKGNAGVFGGVTESLREKGIPPITTTDGPSGIRLAAYAALLPCGTALACTFNPALIQTLYSLVGEEMSDRGTDVLLAPGMNIHRDPLCGRNFEYYSEDPLVSGIMAAAVVKGLRQAGVFACPKHFACNNQETNRVRNNSVLSERALREIYLKGFEICIKLSSPDVIMTSYNKINGVWGHYNYALVTGILRGEWGFNGLVITDWWMRKSRSPEFPNLRDQAYRVRAGVDVLMPGGDRTGKRKPDGTLLESINKNDGITRGELQETAKHVLTFVMKTKKYHEIKEKNSHENNEL